MKRRKDSFWGIHSDFHAKPEMGTVGKTLCEEDIREICRLLKPDYWQVDCKGHPGWASYPTEMGNAMPDFACDTLAMWRKVTREEDVALYLHYSGVIDEKYCAENPDECVVNADGTLDTRSTRRGGRYADELLIPQLSETVEKYGVDGVWLDGECWGSLIDYHPDTVANFEKEMGISLGGELPKKLGDKYFEEYKEFNRELFRRYLRHYVDILHEKYPDFQICSNWMFSDHAPEEVTANVDFLSGDLFPWNSFNWARYAGRALAQQNMPWDLMGWTHRSATEGHLDFLPVHPTQLIQEAASVISVGGGFQQVIGQLTDGSPDMDFLRLLKPLSDFIKKREKYCFRGKLVHQAAMLMSTYDRRRENNELFPRGRCEGKLGLTALMCDIGQSLEVVSEHTLMGNTSDYPLIIVPELNAGLADETVCELLEYAKNGGSLLIVGRKAAELFSQAGAPFEIAEVDDELLSVERVCQSHSAADQRYFTINDCEFGGVFHPVEIVSPSAEVIANTCYTFRSKRHPYAVITNYGKGKIAVIGGDIGTHYITEAQYLHRNLLHAVVEKLYEPMAKIESVVGTLEIVCLEKDSSLMIQLVNANGNHASMSVATEDVIPPVVDVKLSVALASAPKQIFLQPENIELPFTYRDGRMFVEINRIDMHNILEIK